MSASTGVAPAWMITLTVAAKVVGVVITSSPGPILLSIIARCRLKPVRAQRLDDRVDLGVGDIGKIVGQEVFVLVQWLVTWRPPVLFTSIPASCNAAKMSWPAGTGASNVCAFVSNLATVSKPSLKCTVSV